LRKYIIEKKYLDFAYMLFFIKNVFAKIK